MNADEQYLGIVQLGRFQILAPEDAAGDSVQLTTTQMQASVPLESGELDLTRYEEGSAIMVSGHYGGGWIYPAGLIEQAGPILTEVVKHVFGKTAEAS